MNATAVPARSVWRSYLQAPGPGQVSQTAGYLSWMPINVRDSESSGRRAIWIIAGSIKLTQPPTAEIDTWPWTWGLLITKVTKIKRRNGNFDIIRTGSTENNPYLALGEELQTPENGVLV
jgi:hypothetical protein